MTKPYVTYDIANVADERFPEGGGVYAGATIHIYDIRGDSEKEVLRTVRETVAAVRNTLERRHDQAGE